MLSSFIIALREGLEAALIVGILIAYVHKSGKGHLLSYIWGGVAAAVIASGALGALLSFTSAELTPKGEELFAGTTSLLAVGVVTWMVFWMKRTARSLRSDLASKVDQAIVTGSLALAGAAFFAVIREGLETSLFVYSNFKSVANPFNSAIGLTTGFAAAIALGYLIYKSAIGLDLSKFFTYTGIALIIVAAGVLSYGVHEFQELGYLPGQDAFAWDVTTLIAKESLLGGILAGTIGFDTTTSWLQLGLYIAYLGAVLTPYLAKERVKSLVKA
ncbi:MAG: iron transporter [Candidatus Planktophila sp.]|nr:iron transporter [Candidatus Planktophila sp.]